MQESTVVRRITAQGAAAQRRVRPARWIATLAVAATAALGAASAAQAATTANQAPSGASSTTCNGLSSDFSSTVLQAAKNLLATPPDLGTATQQVGQADKLDDAMKNLNCANPPASTTPTSSTPAQAATGSDSSAPSSTAAQSSSAPSSTVSVQQAAPGSSPLSVYFGAPLMPGPLSPADTSNTLPPLSASSF